MFDTVNHDEPIQRIRAGIEALAGEDRSGWLSGSLADLLEEAAAMQERLDAEVLRITAEWDGRRAWEADGAVSAVSWMVHRLPISRSRAQETVRTARFIDRNERVAKAVAAGDVAVEHARVLGRVVNDRRQDLFADHEDSLVDAAQMLSIHDFTKVTRRWGHLADDQLCAADYMAQYNDRRVSIGRTFGGAVHVDMMLDAEGGALFESAVDLLSAPDPKDTTGGPRSAAQRRADAVVQMSRIVLGGAGATGRAPANIGVIVDADTFAGHQHRPAPVDVRCDLDWAGPIGRKTLLRLSCDCSVYRVVMRGRSEVLEMGKKRRLVTTTQRRALSIRDDGCIFPSCDRPDSWCDAHHIVHWSDDGPTDLSNLALLCRRHHVLVHEGGWNLERLPDNTYRARAADP
jgi:hypothetical protein